MNIQAQRIYSQYTSMLRRYQSGYTGPESADDKLFPLELRGRHAAALVRIEKDIRRSNRSAALQLLSRESLADNDTVEDLLVHRIGFALESCLPFMPGRVPADIVAELDPSTLQGIVRMLEEVAREMPQPPWDQCSILDQAAFGIASYCLEKLSHRPEAPADEAILRDSLFWARNCGTAFHRDCGPMRPRDAVARAARKVEAMMRRGGSDLLRLRDAVGQMERFLDHDLTKAQWVPCKLENRYREYEEMPGVLAYNYADQFEGCTGVRWIERLGCEVCGAHFLAACDRRMARTRRAKQLARFVTGSRQQILRSDLGDMFRTVYFRLTAPDLASVTN